MDGSLLVTIIAVIWVVLGILGFIFSIACWVKNPKPVGFNVGGLLMAIFLGPFYWIYYALVKGQSGYCVDQRNFVPLQT